MNAVSGLGPPLSWDLFPELEQGCSDHGKVLDVGLEEVAESHERSDHLYVIGHFWSLNGPQFVFSRAWFHPGWVWNPGKRPFCFRKCICPGWSSSGSGLVDRALAQEFPGACMGVRVYQEVFFVEWNESGQPRSPNGDVIQWNCLLPGMVKAVIAHLISSARIQKWGPAWRRFRNWLLKSLQCILWVPSWSTY